MEKLGEMLGENEVRLQLTALRCLEAMGKYPEVSCKVEEIVTSFDATLYENCEVLEYRKRCALGRKADSLDEDGASRIYLSNLKSAVHWTVKLTQIDMLCDHALAQPETAFHTAMHWSYRYLHSHKFLFSLSKAPHFLLKKIII